MRNLIRLNLDISKDEFDTKHFKNKFFNADNFF